MTLKLADCLRCHNIFAVGEAFTDFCRACLIGHVRECQKILANQESQKHSAKTDTTNATTKCSATSSGPKPTSGTR